MKKILMALTNVGTYGDNPRETGVWLEELTSFYDVMTKAGYEVDFASDKGGIVPVDPHSLMADKRTMEIFHDPAFHAAALERTKKFSDVRPEDYAAVYYCGGHGAMWDFPKSKDLAHVRNPFTPPADTSPASATAKRASWH